MNWFKKTIINWLTENNSSNKLGLADVGAVVKQDNARLNSDATLNFTVYNAIGGKVVEFRRYDRRTDRSDNAVYIIGKDEDFGQKISKIATLEVMKD